jgi:hypothetical protein
MARDYCGGRMADDGGMAQMNLKTWVISKAWYDEPDPGVGKSKLQEHFPHIPGPDQPYDTLTNLRKPWGRHPVTGDPLLVMEVDRFTSLVETPGVMAMADRITPEEGSVPAVCVTAARVYDFDVATAIHAHNQHLVLALETYDGEDPPIEGWGKDDEFPPAQWTKIRDGLVAMGMDADLIDAERAAHPDATRRQFYHWLDREINGQES